MRMPTYTKGRFVVALLLCLSLALASLAACGTEEPSIPSTDPTVTSKEEVPLQPAGESGEAGQDEGAQPVATNDSQGVQPPAPEAEPAVPSEPAFEPKSMHVSVTVDGSRAASQGYGVSFGPAQITLEEGASALDALYATGLSISASGGYVRSIEGLSEFSCGDLSGWMYAVNGSYPRKAASSYVLSSGDVVSWVYTLELGKDL